jgi:bifunctional non-homologous end joining protein LigD
VVGWQDRVVPLPRIEPMKAIAGELPGDDDAWAYEIKWDGMRAVAELGDGSVRLRTTRGNDAAISFPDLSRLGDALDGRPGILDGEIVAFDDHGAPSFGLLQHRMHITDGAIAAARAAEAPVAYVVFDLLHFDGHDSWKLPYLDRRSLLADLVEPGDHWQVPAYRIGGGAELLAAARDRGLEGVMAKRPDRPYEPGKRSGTWRKVKVRHTQEFVVGGWLPGEGNRSGHLGALLLGCHRRPGHLDWVGNVGTGFSFAELTRLGARLNDLAVDTCPFDERPIGPKLRAARWVRPELVVQCEFGAWTTDGKLRHASYLGERTDKLAAEVTCDP